MSSLDINGFYPSICLFFLFFFLQDSGSADEKRSLSTSISSEETPTDTEQSPDSDESHSNRKKTADSGSIRYGFESLHTYEKRMSSLPPQPSSRADSDFRGFSSLESAESRGLIGGSRSLKARLAERARTLEAERRRQAEEKRMAEEQPDQNTQEEDAADEDRFYKKVNTAESVEMIHRMFDRCSRMLLDRQTDPIGRNFQSIRREIV